MKKYALTLGLSILALAACGKQAEQADSKPDSQQAEETTMAAEDSQTSDSQRRPVSKQKFPLFVGQIIGPQWKPLHRVDSCRMYSGCTPMNPSVI